ncbi:putative DNA-binding protein with PD1-like motif [Paraburkholderia unamae]|uniref:PPC domain-containing DNA-binding protein n=1 Tax=Paraburkholderia unamae TaxID=219649 RepID=UPI000DC5314A|nr:PPC domain-containing DNA-binding protein [Paraburkholderia unamae]RAR48836.1 putative DNA-binding protein with PD1-like motif [Paraburkholderia unamae]
MNTSAPSTITVESGHYGRLVVARLKPGEDLVDALVQLCESHGIRRAVVRSAVGSLLEARLAHGSAEAAQSVNVPGPGVEILNAFGEVSLDDGARTSISGMVADTQGRMYAGYFVPGANRSFITIEVTLQEWIVEGWTQESVPA